MRSEDLERIRRSLAMSPSLPPDVAAELLAEIGRIIEDRSAIRDLLSELERLVAELRRHSLSR